MKKIYKYLLFFAGFLIFIFYIISHDNERVCSLYQEYLNTSFDGVIVKKFIDPKEHSYPFIYILECTTICKLNLTNDKSNVYNDLELNDSIAKFKNDPWIYKRLNHRFIRIKAVDFDCKTPNK